MREFPVASLRVKSRTQKEFLEPRRKWQRLRIRGLPFPYGGPKEAIETTDLVFDG